MNRHILAMTGIVVGALVVALFVLAYVLIVIDSFWLIVLVPVGVLAVLIVGGVGLILAGMRPDHGATR